LLSKNHLELPINELQAITHAKRRFIFDRIASVAAMQEQAQNSDGSGQTRWFATF
jgi:hypothetical protein